jgi:hypothetical protein
MMSREFDMSMIGELSFFLGLQVKQIKDETFFCQSKYVNDLLKRFGMDNLMRFGTKGTTSPELSREEHGGLP